MHVIEGRSAGYFIVKGQFALHTTQKGLGEQLGVARRTVTRWVTGTSSPSEAQLAHLARLVHPNDAPLASQIALALGATLESLGIVAPAPPPAPVVAPPPLPFAGAAPLGAPERVDLVVCVAAEAMDLSPRAVRSALFAAFKRAAELGLTLADVQAVLAPAVPATKRASTGSSKARTAPSTS